MIGMQMHVDLAQTAIVLTSVRASRRESQWHDEVAQTAGDLMKGLGEQGKYPDESFQNSWAHPYDFAFMSLSSPSNPPHLLSRRPRWISVAIAHHSAQLGGSFFSSVKA